MTHGRRQETIELVNLLPKEWRDDDGRVGVMQSVHTCLRFSPAQIRQPYLTGRIEDAVYLVFETAGLKFNKVTLTFTSVIRGVPQFSTHASEEEAPAGTYIMFFTQYADGGPVSETEALAKIEAARGLVNAVEGMNATYHHLFDNQMVLPDGQQSATSPAIQNLNVFPAPFAVPDRLSAVAGGLAPLPQDDRSRIMLSLRWFDKAERETEPIDAFLKMWFALETLVMPDTTDIRPINIALTRIYDLSRDDVTTRFKIGRIFGLRSDIVHNGQVRSIHQQLQRYIQAVYVDILFDLLGQASERRAEAVLDDATFNHAAWMP